MTRASDVAKLITNGGTIVDGNIAFADGHGLSFAATADSSGTMSSELLEDYEEGTFTPVLADATSGGNTATISIVLGDYIKVGNLVLVSIAMANINPSGMTSGNSIFVRGLPFTSKTRTSPGNISQHLVVRCDRINVASDCFGVVANVGSGATLFTLNQLRDSVGDENLKVSSIHDTSTNTSDIFITGCYIAD